MIYNTRIKYSFLGLDGDGNLCFQLGFECKNGLVFNSEKLRLEEASFIKDLLNVLELSRWEDLPRKFARIEVLDGSYVSAIGNLIEERWVKL